MTRVRVALALLILALAVPIALLVVRALASVELERQVRHQAVAERVFDEMERTLSQFLQAEEARPAADYRFYSSLDEGGAAADMERERSPLSRPSDHPFIIGHFQIEPDGRFTTPLRPADESIARRAGDWPEPEPAYARTRRAIDELELRVAPFWRAARTKRFAHADRQHLLEEVARDAGSTADVMKETREAAAAPARAKAEAGADGSRARAAKKSVSAYEALQSLNRGAEQRLERKQVIRDAPRPTRLAANEPAPRAASVAEAEEQSEQLARKDEADSSYGSGSSLLGQSAPFADADLGTAMQALAQSPRTAQIDDRVRIILEPMVGQPLGGGQLMLYRTVLVGQQGYRQGVLLDEDRLGQWLEQAVVAGGGLERSLQLRFGRAASTGPTAANRYGYVHLFAEPFDDLGLRLDVAVASASTRWLCCSASSDSSA